MPGFHVTQLLLRAEVSVRAQRFCSEQLSIGRGEQVILYCTSTAVQGPDLWEVCLCEDSLAVIGSQGYVLYGTMRQAALDFYDMTIVEGGLFHGSNPAPVPFPWHVYPDLVWGFSCVGLAYYYGSYAGHVDLYFQTASMMGSDLYHHCQVLGIGRDPTQWWRGERRYYRLVQMPDWRRAPLGQARL